LSFTALCNLFRSCTSNLIVGSII